MSEESKPAVPAASTASAPGPAREVSAPLTSFVRGGTISSAAEYQLQAKRADAEKRRKAEDARHAEARMNPSEARIHTADLGSKKNHAAIVLEIRNSDDVAEEFITCELNAGRGEDPTELVLVMCCPKCALRVGMSEAQFHFSNKHRKFELDQRRAGELWVNPKDPREFVTIAGVIQLTEAVSCPLGCGWRFKIDSSVIKTI